MGQEWLKGPEHFLFHWWALKVDQGQRARGLLNGRNRRSGVVVMIHTPAGHPFLRAGVELLQGMETVARDPWRRA